MTANVHRKCKFYSMISSQCTLTHGKVQPWDDACVSYTVKPLIQIEGLDQMMEIK